MPQTRQRLWRMHHVHFANVRCSFLVDRFFGLSARLSRKSFLQSWRRKYVKFNNSTLHQKQQSKTNQRQQKHSACAENVLVCSSTTVAASDAISDRSMGTVKRCTTTTNNSKNDHFRLNKINSGMVICQLLAFLCTLSVHATGIRRAANVTWHSSKLQRFVTLNV